MTQAIAKKICAAHGCTMRKTTGGDYVVRCKLSGETYYTDDTYDAATTAERMQHTALLHKAQGMHVTT